MKKSESNLKAATDDWKFVSCRNTQKRYTNIIALYTSFGKHFLLKLRRIFYMENYTLNSIEVAEMVEKEHSKLLKDIRRYTEQLNEAKIGLVEFFKESTYIDGKGESRPCYLVTKKGCEFIAHKLTGKKGTEFTARYINRFHEMENELISINVSEIRLGELARYLAVMDRVAHRQNLAPHKIAENFKKVSEQFGIQLSEDFVNVPEYEQMTFSDIIARH